MSVSQSPLTYEGILEMFRQTARKFQETDRKLDRMIEDAGAGGC